MPNSSKFCIYIYIHDSLVHERKRESLLLSNWSEPNPRNRRAWTAACAKRSFLRTLLRAWGEQVTVRDTDQIIRSVRCISQMTRLKNRLKPNNAWTQSLSQAGQSMWWEQMKLSLVTDPGPLLSLKQSLRPAGVHCDPACGLAYGKFISWWPIGWVGISWDPIDKNSHSELKRKIPKYRY